MNDASRDDLGQYDAEWEAGLLRRADKVLGRKERKPRRVDWAIVCVVGFCVVVGGMGALGRMTYQGGRRVLRGSTDGMDVAGQMLISDGTGDITTISVAEATSVLRWCPDSENAAAFTDGPNPEGCSIYADGGCFYLKDGSGRTFQLKEMPHDR